MRSIVVASILAVAGAGSFVACVADDSVDDGEEIADDGKQDAQSRPVGTFEASRGSGSPYERLTLLSDGSFVRQEVVFCITAPCPPITTRGTVKYTRSGSTRYIRFLDASGELIDRYAYRFGAPADLPILSLRPVNTRTWMDLELADQAFCAAPKDCELQNLGHVECLGAWSCSAENACAYSCSTQSTCPDPAAPGVHYVGGGDSGRPIRFCLLADFACADGQNHFDNAACGCGCVPE